MPIYAYRCADCGHAQDVLQKMSDPLLTVCPACGQANYQKQLTSAGFQLKGSGWYVTDFREGNKGKPGDAKDGEKGDDKRDEKGDAKEGVKPEVPADAKAETQGGDKAAAAAPVKGAAVTEGGAGKSSTVPATTAPSAPKAPSAPPASSSSAPAAPTAPRGGS